MEGEAVMQATFDSEKITVSVRMFGGDVLVTRTFEGSNMYGKFVDFIKEQFGAGNAVRAVVAAGGQCSGTSDSIATYKDMLNSSGGH